MFLEISKLIIYCGLIVLISKQVLVTTLRKLAISLELKSKTIGNIAGYATSMPEFLTIIISSFNGLIETGIFNILSSNIINFLQYIISIIVNKNRRSIFNMAIKIDIIFVLLTILIPIILIWKNIEINLFVVFLFIILYILFFYLNNNAHKLYLEKEDKQIQKKIDQGQNNQDKDDKKKIVGYIFILLFTGIALFIISNLLGENLNNLCKKFNISEIIIGILLGLITSIPELITFLDSQKHYKRNSSNKMLGVVEATNNLLTSNLLNLFIIQSIGIVIYHIFY